MGQKLVHGQSGTGVSMGVGLYETTRAGEWVLSFGPQFVLKHLFCLSNIHNLPTDTQ